MSGVIDSIERAQLRRVPSFQAGDRVRVHFQVVEGTRRRTQVFEGIVIKRQGSGVRETFTVRKQSFGVGVERTFPVHSPKIERIEVAARGDVRRAKLYYLRERVGRASRVRERRWTGAEEVIEPGLVEAGAMPPDDAPRPGEEELGEQVATADADGAPRAATRRRPPRRRRPAPEAEAPAEEPDDRRRAGRGPAGRRPGVLGGPEAGTAQVAKSKEKTGHNSLVELVMIVAVALGLALGIQAFLVKPFRIPSESMVPTLEVGQRVLVDRVSFRFGDPDRGDIVVFKPPAGADVGRCAASSTRATSRARRRRPSARTRTSSSAWWPCPGDRLKVLEGSVYINGKRQKEPFARLDPECGTCNLPREITIPDGHYYMMGDNRGESADSREWGPVPKKWIIGKAFMTYWPPGRIGLL